LYLVLSFPFLFRLQMMRAEDQDQRNIAPALLLLIWEEVGKNRKRGRRKKSSYRSFFTFSLRSAFMECREEKKGWGKVSEL